MKRSDQDGTPAVSSRLIDELSFEEGAPSGLWAERTLILWQHRQLLVRIAVISLVISLSIAFLIPKRYTAATSIMPPDSQNSNLMLLPAMASRGGLGALAGIAGGLFHDHGTTALFVTLLHSGEIADHLINRFDLRRAYHKRYYVDAAKRLAHMTKISDDKKSGVISIEVEDTDPVRARDLAEAYLQELNELVNRTSTSAAKQERIFIEQRLQKVQDDLENAEVELSDFSSRNTTVDITAQTRATVDVGARIEGEIVAERSGLQSMRQVYGDDNVQVRQAEARIGMLEHELSKLAGASNGDASTSGKPNTPGNQGAFYPALRQLPRLAVRYADLYRRVKVQETVYELLTQQYEMARIEEAKDVPVVRIIDSPGIPEKKSYPPRLLFTAIMTLLAFGTACVCVLTREYWATFNSADPRRRLADAITTRFSHQRSAPAFATKSVL